MRDLDWQFGISNLAGDFNMNFFTYESVRKNDFFRKIEIRKIGDIFAINISEKIPDHQSSSKNPVVSKNWRSNYRGSTVLLHRNLFITLTAMVWDITPFKDRPQNIGSKHNALRYKKMTFYIILCGGVRSSLKTP